MCIVIGSHDTHLWSSLYHCLLALCLDLCKLVVYKVCDQKVIQHFTIPSKWQVATLNNVERIYVYTSRTYKNADIQSLMPFLNVHTNVFIVSYLTSSFYLLMPGNESQVCCHPFKISMVRSENWTNLTLANRASLGPCLILSWELRENNNVELDRR